MTTIEQRASDAIESMEYAADVAEKFVDPNRILDIATNTGSVKTLASLSRDVSLKSGEVASSAQTALSAIESAENSVVSEASRVISSAESNLAVEANRITSEAATAISRISHFREEEFIAENTFNEDKIYFVEGGVVYAPLVFPYISGSSISADVIANKLFVLQGLTVLDIGDGPDQITTNRQAYGNIKYFPSLSDATAAIQANPGLYKNVITVSHKSQEECSFKGCNYPDGGGSGYIVGNGYGVEDGFSIISAGAEQLKIIIKDTINAECFGLYDGQTDAFSALRSCVVFGRSIGMNIITLDVNIECELDDQEVFSEVIFVGRGSLSGIYRKSVFNSLVGRDKPVCAAITERNQVSKENPIVVLVGDSIASYSANTRNRNYMLAGAIESKIRKDFSNPEFFNRAIGGATLAGLDGVSSRANEIEWYEDSSLPWLDYVENLSPDIVFISFGMNDSRSINYDRLKSVTAKIKDFSSSPKIIFCTPLVPSLSGNASGLTATKDEQEGRDYAAGLIRTFAEYHGYGLLDFNRRNNVARDGIDVVGGRIGSKEEFINPLSPIIGAIECHNFRFKLTVDETRLLDSSSHWIDLALDDERRSKVRIRNAGGVYRFVIYSATASGVIEVLAIKDSSIAVASSLRNIVVEVLGGKIVIYDDADNFGESSAPLASFRTIRPGGLMIPRVDFSSSGIVSYGQVDRSDSFLSPPEISNDKLWGDKEDTSGIKLWGGSGWNHPSSHIFSYVYDPVLSSVTFKANIPKLLASVRSLVFSDIPVTASLVTPAGAKYGAEIVIPPTGFSSVILKAERSALFGRINIYHRCDGGSDGSVFLQIAAAKPETLGVDILFTGLVSVSNGVPNTVGIITVDVGSGLSSKVVDFGGEILLYRNGSDPLDDYGNLNFISVDIG